MLFSIKHLLYFLNFQITNHQIPSKLLHLSPPKFSFIIYNRGWRYCSTLVVFGQTDYYKTAHHSSVLVKSLPPLVVLISWGKSPPHSLTLLFRMPPNRFCYSTVLENFRSYAFKSKSFEEFNDFLLRTNNLSPHVAQNILKLTLLDVSMFSFEDILEFRRQLQNELERFREALGTITHSVLVDYDERYLVSGLDDIVKYRILPAVDELETKIKHSKTKLMSKLLDALKNPVAYVPILGTIFHMIPLQLAFLLSLGLVSFETAVNFIMEQKQLTNNGLYYLARLRKKAR